MNLTRKLAAEFLGTAALVTATVSAGVMATKFQASPALALLYVGIATGGVLALLILTLGGISGAHFNPAVSLVMVVRKSLSAREFGLYVVAQLTGAFAGIAVANAMNALPVIQVSEINRSDNALLLGEVVATVGLVGLILALIKLHKESAIAVSVATWVAAAIMFTSSTCFANPAVTFGRIFTSSGSGIAPTSALFFALVQFLSALVAIQIVDKLFDKE